jgi:hypothetical protein
VLAAIALFGSAWRTLVGVCALFIVPLTLLQSWFLRDVDIGPAPTEEQIAEVAAIVGPFALVSLLVVGPLLTVAVLRGAAERLAGEGHGIEDLARIGARWILSVLLVLVLYSVAVTVGTFAFILPGVWLFVRLYVATAAVAIEGRRGSHALVRSWRLTRGRFWRVAGALVLMVLVVLAVLLTVGAVVGVLALAAGEVAWIVDGVLGGLLNAAVVAFVLTVEAVIYLHLRANADLEFDETALASDLVRTKTR